MNAPRGPGHAIARRLWLVTSILVVVGAALGARARFSSTPLERSPEYGAGATFPPGSEIDSAHFRRLILDRWRFVPSLHQRKPQRWEGSPVWQIVMERTETGLIPRLRHFLSIDANPRRGGRIDLRIRFQDSSGNDFDTVTIDAAFDTWMHRVSDASPGNPTRLAFRQESMDRLTLELPNYADTALLQGFVSSFSIPYRRADSSPPPWADPLPPPLDSLAMRHGIEGAWRFVPTNEHPAPQDWANGNVWQIIIEPCDDLKDPTYRNWMRVMSYTQTPVPRARDDLLADRRIRFLGADGHDIDTVAFAARFDAASRSIWGRAFAREKWPEVEFTLSHPDTLIFEQAYARIRDSAPAAGRPRDP